MLPEASFEDADCLSNRLLKSEEIVQSCIVGFTAFDVCRYRCWCLCRRGRVGVDGGGAGEVLLALAMGLAVAVGLAVVRWRW